MSESAVLHEIKSHIGKDLGVSDWVLIDQDRINAFADCTGDHQWIHVNPALAKEGLFGTTIVHGYLLLSLLVAMSDRITVVPADCKMVVNYGLNRVRFVTPVKVGSRIRNHAVLKQVEDKGSGRILVTIGNTVEIENEEKPALVAETLSMYFT